MRCVLRSLLAALALRSSRLAASWIAQHKAVPQLVALVYLGVPPTLKAAAFSALTALATHPSNMDMDLGKATLSNHAGVNGSLDAGGLGRLSEIAVAMPDAAGSIAAGEGLAKSIAPAITGSVDIWQALHPNSVADAAPCTASGIHAPAVANPVRPLPSARDGCAQDMSSRISVSMFVPERAQSGIRSDHAAAGGVFSITNSNGNLPELLKGLKEDVIIEQRHQAYPQTLAFLRLLRQIIEAHVTNEIPLPYEMTYCTRTRTRTAVHESRNCCPILAGFS